MMLRLLVDVVVIPADIPKLQDIIAEHPPAYVRIRCADDDDPSFTGFLYGATEVHTAG